MGLIQRLRTRSNENAPAYLTNRLEPENHKLLNGFCGKALYFLARQFFVLSSKEKTIPGAR